MTAPTETSRTSCQRRSHTDSPQSVPAHPRPVMRVPRYTVAAVLSVEDRLDALAQLRWGFGRLRHTVAPFGPCRSRLEPVGVGNDHLLVVRESECRPMQIRAGVGGDAEHERPLEQPGGCGRVACDLDAKAVAGPCKSLERLAGKFAVAIVAAEDGQLEQPVGERNVRVERSQGSVE